MLLLEGGQGLGQLKIPCRHMETALVSVAIVPTRCKSHHHRHFVLSLLLLDGGRYLPTGLASAAVDDGPIMV